MGNYAVYGAIERKWTELKKRPVDPVDLGQPVNDESDTVDGFGRTQTFEKGMMSWYHSSPAAFAVYGLIGKRWLELGREAFGYPIIDESETGDGQGRYNHFRGYNASDETFKGEASIFFKPDRGAHEVYGGIRDKWAEMGWEKSSAGYPVSAERDRRDGPGREQKFEHGRFTWAPDVGAVYDPIPHVRFEGVEEDKFVVGGFNFTPGGSVEISLMPHADPTWLLPQLPPRLVPRYKPYVLKITADSEGNFSGVVFEDFGKVADYNYFNLDARDIAADPDKQADGDVYYPAKAAWTSGFAAKLSWKLER